MSDPVVADDVRHVAGLARIALQEEDIEAFRAEFEEILEHFDRLEEVPHVARDGDLENVLRADEARASLERAAAMRNAPAEEEGYFKGPPVG